MAKEIDYQYCSKTLELKDMIERSYLVLGERLMKIRDGELFRGQWETFEAFVNDMKMSKATASKIINIYQRFVVEYGISPERILGAGGWSVVAEALPLIRTKSDAEGWLHSMEHLSRDDVRREIREKRTGISQIKCNHDNSYTIKVCRDCGFKEAVHQGAEAGA